MNYGTERRRSPSAAILGITIMLALQGWNPLGNTALADTASTGVITLISGGGNFAETCHFPVANIDRDRVSLGCGLWNPRYINLKAVPSATTVRFIGYEGNETCSGSKIRYSIEFKTRGTYTGIDPLDIQEILKNAEPNKVIAANFQVSDVVRDPAIDGRYNYIRDLSCMQVRDSNDVAQSQSLDTASHGTNIQTAEASPAADKSPYGNILLTHSDGTVCTLPITGADIRKSKWAGEIPGCGRTFKRFTKMQLENVPSAVTIYLRSFGYREDKADDYVPAPDEPMNDCDRGAWDYAFRLEIKTTGKIDNISKAFDLDDIASTSPGNAVVANVRMIDYSRELTRFYWPTTYYFSCFKFDLGNS